mmetsp:Transcript_1241/g.2937  ORF Transcript_1241/g.2937 Transcript_1241/m.2937 type:complete len:121 (+) Transcript_1241:309-671(+)
MALRRTAVLFKSLLPSPEAPTQLILKELLKKQPLTTEELWEKVKHNQELFPSKHRMKHCVKYLNREERIISKPLDPKNPTGKFGFRLGNKPKIVSEDGLSVLDIEEQGKPPKMELPPGQP